MKTIGEIKMKKIILMIAVALMAVSCSEQLESGADDDSKEKPVKPVDPVSVVPIPVPALDLKYPDAGEEVRSLVFDAGTDGHIYYRIPALAETTKGTILAFCEARNTKADFYEGNESKFAGIPVFQQGSSKDAGNIDLVVKRSTDGGATWSAMATLFDDGNNTCGNPSPVVDLTTGRIWLFWCWQKSGSQSSKMFPSITDGHTRRVLCTWSDDDGVTWSAPVDMTSTLKAKDWTWYATGPCHALQVKSGAYSGRLIIPANHRDAANKNNYTHCCYSDNLGKTWKLGGVTALGGNESCIVELSDGNVMTSMRVSANCRAFSRSSDGGVTWGSLDLAEQLIDPNCQGAATNYYDRNVPSSTILLSNCHHKSSRTMVSISVSKDNGSTWTTPYTVYGNRSAYSDIIVLADGSVCVLYECGYGKYGTINPNEQIKFVRLPKSIIAQCFPDLSSGTFTVSGARLRNNKFTFPFTADKNWGYELNWSTNMSGEVSVTKNGDENWYTAVVADGFVRVCVVEDNMTAQERKASFTVSLGKYSHEITVVQNPMSGTVKFNGWEWMDSYLGGILPLTEENILNTDTYGYYYQWGRNIPFPTYGTVATVESSPARTYAQASQMAEFIVGDSNLTYEWLTISPVPADRKTTWKDRTGGTDPCPAGYHVPSFMEYQSIMPYTNAAGVGNFTNNVAVLKSGEVFRGKEYNALYVTSGYEEATIYAIKQYKTDGAYYLRLCRAVNGGTPYLRIDTVKGDASSDFAGAENPEDLQAAQILGSAKSFWSSVDQSKVETIFFPAAGRRARNNGEPSSQGLLFCTWTATTWDANSSSAYFDAVGSNNRIYCMANNRAHAHPVRCLKDYE